MTDLNTEVTPRESTNGRVELTRHSRGASRLRIVVETLGLFAVPLIMLIVFTLPAEVKRAYAFSYTEPTILTAFTAHYIHLTSGHLMGNVAGFLLLVAVAYGLSAIVYRRRLFFTSLVTFLTVFPLMLSGLNLVFPRNAIGYGFSGINMALFGYVAVILATAVSDRFDIDEYWAFPTLFFALSSYIAAIVLSVSAASIGLISVCLLLTLTYGCAAGCHSIQSLRQIGKRVIETPLYGELVVVAVVVLFGYPFVGFPAVPAAGPRINLYIHFLGYALSYLVISVSQFLDRSDHLWRRTSASSH